MRYSKFRNVFTVVDGIKFRSKSEATRYQELKLLERAGAISGLKLQVRYPLNVGGNHITTYVADFTYTEYVHSLQRPQTIYSRFVVEDRKGYRTPDYIIKAKLMKALYGYEIRETGRTSKRKPILKRAA